MNYTDALRLAYSIALRSPDPSTQNGALLGDTRSRPDGVTPITETFACNEFPQGIRYTDERWERPLKYSIVAHAEANTIFAAAKRGLRAEHCTLIACWAACSSCAQAIIQSGVMRLVRHAYSEDGAVGRWKDSIALADQMLAEAGVEVIEITDKLGDVQPIRRDGELWFP